MADGRVEQVRDVVMGIRPVYTDRGNCFSPELCSRLESSAAAAGTVITA